MTTKANMNPQIFSGIWNLGISPDDRLEIYNILKSEEDLLDKPKVYRMVAYPWVKPLPMLSMKVWYMGQISVNH